MGNRFREKAVEEGLQADAVEETPVVETAIEEGEGQERPTGNAEAGEQVRKRASRGGKAAGKLGRILGGDLLADKMVTRQIPLLLLCLIYLLVIVANRYHVETLSREKQATEERINYLREHRIQMQKQYQQTVKISQIAETLKDRGVGLTAGPPYEL